MMALTDLDAAILRQLAAGESRSATLAEALAAAVRTIQDRLGRLRDAGLVASPSRGSWQLTGAGRRAALANTVPEAVASLAILGSLPAEHRAALRLVEDAVIARRVLASAYPTNWPSFILAGPTKTGKTLVGQLAARRLGLDPEDAVRLLMLETPGSLVGRRVQTGADSWTTIRSPLLALPVITLDEFDKAAPELRQAAFAYLAGSCRYRSEGMEVEVNATAIITLNVERDAGRLLPDAALRRSVVFDTTSLVDATHDLDETARLLARADLPVVPENLAPPAPELPEGARRALRLLLQRCLTAAGWRLCDVEALSRLALGRWTQTPEGADAAVISVAADYFLVTETRPGLVEPDWPARVEGVLGDAAAPITSTLAAARERRAAILQQERDAERVALDASIELAGTRERLLQRLDSVTRTSTRAMTAAERETFAELRGKAHRLRVAASEARSADTLVELGGDIERLVLAPARAIAAARQWRAEQVKAESAKAQAARRAARERRTVLQGLAHRTATDPGEDVLGALLSAGCLVAWSEEYEEETLGSQLRRFADPIVRALRPPEEPAPSPPVYSDPWRMPGPSVSPAALDVLNPSGLPAPASPAPHYVTKTRTRYADLAGRRYAAFELEAWNSEPVRAILAAAAADADLPPLRFPKQPVPAQPRPASARPGTRRTPPRLR